MADVTTPSASQVDPALPPLPTSLRQYTFQPSAPLEQTSAPPLYPLAPGSTSGTEPVLPLWGDTRGLYPDTTTTVPPSYPFSAPSAPPLYPALQDTISSPSYPSLEQNIVHSSPLPLSLDAAALPPFVYVLPARPGLSRDELRDLYSPPGDLTSTLSDFERRSTTAIHHNDLYDYMNAYERASASIQQTKLALFQLQQKAKSHAGKLWTVRTKTEVVQATCADGATISHSYSYQVGNYEPDMATKLKKSLHRLMIKKAKVLVRQQFEETTCRLWIEDRLSSMMNSASWATAKDQQHAKLDPTTVRKDLETVKDYLDVLFYFERTVRRQPDFDDEHSVASLGRAESKDDPISDVDAKGTTTTDDKDQPPNSVVRSIRDWIALLVGAVLEYGDFNDRIYLLMHVFRSRQSAAWSATFLQCEVPKHWSDPFLEYYLLQYSLILCGPSSLASNDDSVALLWGRTLDEDDYLAIIDQIDIPVFFQRLVDHYCSPSSSNSGKVHQSYVERRALRVLAICHSLFDWTITGLERHLQYPVMAKRLVQTLCQFCQILGDHLMILRRPSEESLSLESAMTLVQTEVDGLFLRVLRIIISLPAHGLWSFLPSIPFRFMSHHAINMLVEETAVENIEHWIMDPIQLLDADPESNRLRTLLGRNPGEGVFFLAALANMAQSKVVSREEAKINNNICKSQEQILGYRMAEIICFLLVDVAFLDSDIRTELSRPVREILATLCDNATDLISFLLRVIDRHFHELGTMALYLFKELPLEEWDIDEQDFSILARLLGHPPLGSAESMFARHVFSSLDWGNLQRPEKSSIHDTPNNRVLLSLQGELALVIADTCIAYMNRAATAVSSAADNTRHMATSQLLSSPPTDVIESPNLSTLAASSAPEQGLLLSFTSAIPQVVANLAANSGIHPSIEQAAWRSYMDWAWSMFLKLRLIDVPVLSLRQASRLHFQDTGGFFSKIPLLNEGQQAFVKAVHLMLTEASRDSGSFAVEGWTTLSNVLQADQGPVLIGILGNVLPMLISGSKEEAEQNKSKFLEMLQEIAGYKLDPFLSSAGQAIAEAAGLFPIENVSAELLGIWIIMQRSLGLTEGANTVQRTYSTLHSSQQEPGNVPTQKNALQFWISSVFSQKDWMMHSELVQIMDLVCLVANELGLEGFVKDQLLEQQILLSIGYRRSPGMSGELMGIAQPRLDRVMDLLPERLSRALPIPQGSNDPSLLVGNWSVKTFAATLLTQQSMVEEKSFWFAYQVLKVETHLEREMRIKVGLYYEQHPEELGVRGNIKPIVKRLGITNRKTIFNFSIWRWAQHLLALPMDHTLQPLYWHMFFSLYFNRTDTRRITYGHKFLESSASVLEGGEPIVGQLKDRLQKLYSRLGQEARKCIQAKQVDRADRLIRLHDLYLAMYGWLSEPLLLTSNIELRRIRKDLLPDRLSTCRLTDQQEFNVDLWRDLLVPQVLTVEQIQQEAASRNQQNQKSSPTSSHIKRLSFFAKAIGHAGGHSSSVSPRSSPRSLLRMQRQQWNARQDQKISNCLVKQAKPGPVFYLPKPVVRMPSLLDHRTNARGLFREITQTFKDNAKSYQNTLTAYQNLDKSYLDELHSLYHNETRCKRLDIACDSTPNTLCKKPAAFDLRYEEVMANDKVHRLIVDNRTRIRELKLGSVDTTLCLAALEMAKVIEKILDYLTSSPSPAGDDRRESGKDVQTLDSVAKERLHQLAIESFYFIHSELLKDAENGYPPAQLILERTVDSLGRKVVALDSVQTEPILDLMGTGAFSILLLHQIFNPANQPKEFVRYYQRIATCKEYDLASKDLLLRQFDVFAWACPETSPSTAEEDTITVMDRLEFYEVAFKAMMVQQQQEQQDKEIPERELRTMDRLAIIKSHRELAGTLLLNFLGQDYINYLRILLDTCAITCLEPEVLQDYIRILGVDPRLVLSLLDGSHVHYQPGGEMRASLDAASSNSEPQSSIIEKRQQQLQKRKGQKDRTLERQEAARKGMTRLGLSDYDLGCLVRFLEDYFVQSQENMVLGNLLDRYAGYTVYIADLIAIVLCDERFLTQWMDQSARAASFASHNQQPYDPPQHCPLWRDTFRVFRPWLSCLTEHAVDEIRFQRQQGGASRMLFTFVGIVNKATESIYRHFQSPLWCETSLFNAYLDIIQGTIGSQGTVNQIMLIHQHFRRLDWRQLEWPQSDMVPRILHIQSKLDVESRSEFWTYLVTVVMDKVQTRLWGAASDGFPALSSTVGSFEQSMLRLGLCILQDVDQVAREDPELETLFLHRIWSIILGYYPWYERMTSRQLAEEVDRLPTQWERTASLMDLESPLGVLLYWLRITIGIEAGQGVLDGDLLGEWRQQQSLQEQSRDNVEVGGSKTGAAIYQYSNPDDDSLQSERVLVYFHYLLRLALVRLSSSASDDQNVNFRLDAIPAIVTHLGQVLDFIAGDQTETRHSSIAAPLTSLLGLVNYCYKTGYFRTLEVVLEGFHAMLSHNGLDVVHAIQLDILRTCCQSLTSIPLMVFLLEEAIEREFDLWDDCYAQTGKLFVHPSTLSSASGTIGVGGMSNVSSVNAPHTAPGLGLMGRTDFALVSTALPIIAASSPFMTSDQDTMNPGTGTWDNVGPPTAPSPSYSASLSSSLQDSHSLQGEHLAIAQRGRHSWKRICQQLETPEMAEQEFMDQCLEQGALLTLYAWFLQRRRLCESHYEFDAVLELGQELALVIARVDLSGGPLAGASGGGGSGSNTQELHGGEVHGGEPAAGFLSWVAQRSSRLYGSVGAKHNRSGTASSARSRKAHEVLLLLEMYLQFVSKEAVHNIKQSRFLDSLVLICETLEGWFQDRDDSIRKFLPGLGLWTSWSGQGSSAPPSPQAESSNSAGLARERQRSQTSSKSSPHSLQPLPHRIEFDTKFKLVARILYTYIATRLQDKGIPLHRSPRAAGTFGGWRRASLQPQAGGGAGRHTQAGGAASSKQSVDLMETLTTLPIKNKDYGAIIMAGDENTGNSGSSSSGHGPTGTTASPTFTTARQFGGGHGSSAMPPPRPSSASAINRTQQYQDVIHNSRHAHSGSETSLLALALGRTSTERHTRTFSNSSNGSGGGDVGSLHRHSISSSWDESAMDYIKLRPPSWIALGEGANSPVWPLPSAVIKKQVESDIDVNGDRHVFVLRTNADLPSKRIMVATSIKNPPASKKKRQSSASIVAQRDFDWAVAQIQDKRMRILEAHEFLKELMMRFYPDEARFTM